MYMVAQEFICTLVLCRDDEDEDEAFPSLLTFRNLIVCPTAASVVQL